MSNEKKEKYNSEIEFSKKDAMDTMKILGVLILIVAVVMIIKEIS